jgi:hypothetical protein
LHITGAGIGTNVCGSCLQGFKGEPGPSIQLCKEDVSNVEYVI